MRKAKFYLSQVYRLDKLIDNKLIELNTLKEMGTSISAVNYDIKVKTSVHSDKVSNTIFKIIDLEENINEDINKLVDIKKDVIETIDKIDDNDLKCLLQCRYLQFKTWEQIAVEMEFSYQWVHKLHARALDKIENLID